MKVAVVGAGWAGLATAVRLTQRGHAVTVFEAAREPGGRARRLDDGLDNGQHILIGAYTETLRIMREVGVDPDRALLRVPLDLRDMQGNGIALPALAPPWNLLAGGLRARGWTWRERIALLSTAASWQRAGFACSPGLTVAQLCERVDTRVMRELIEPLCISALNTLPQQASAQVFLRVLQDSLKAGTGASDLLLPRVDLGTLFPHAAANWLRRAGASVHLGCRITQVQAGDTHRWLLYDASSTHACDALVLATHAPDAIRLLGTLPAQRRQQPLLTQWLEAASTLQYEAIATVYSRGGRRLPRPMIALAGHASGPAQFVFDREWLGGTSALKAFVVSASSGSRGEIEASVLAQAHAEGLGELTALRTVVEKRATFACTPQLARPGHRVTAGLWACADYVDGPYPSTLEGAVRTAQRVSEAIGTATVS